MGVEPEGILIGTAVAGCIVEDVLGRGGMGVVYRARDYALARTVALKIIHPDVAAEPEMRDRFLREARAAAAIQHPNVVPIYQVGQEENSLYLVMRFVETGDLETLLTAGQPAPATVISIIEQTASALDAAHTAGLVHRDVKPQNILIDTAGGEPQVYLTDFGLVRRLDEPGKTLPGTVLGTPWYMAPEQARGQPADHRADVYALGCVLFQLLTDRVPYDESDSGSVLVAHQIADIPSAHALRPDLPRAIDVVIERALAKEPDDRYGSAGELAAAAKAALETPVDAGDADQFPEPTRSFIQTQGPRMTPERFDEFVEYLAGRGWSRRDIREVVNPFAPRDWKRRQTSGS